MKTARPTHDELKSIAFKDFETKKIYNDLEEEYKLLAEMVHARQKVGKTQAEIAEIMGIKTSAVGRLESTLFYQKHSPTFATLKKYAHALGCKLELRLTQN